jgi:hypothetical protein
MSLLAKPAHQRKKGFGARAAAIALYINNNVDYVKGLDAGTGAPSPCAPLTRHADVEWRGGWR